MAIHMLVWVTRNTVDVHSVSAYLQDICSGTEISVFIGTLCVYLFTVCMRQRRHTKLDKVCYRIVE